ncbi:MAG TPA: hypothetical protein VHX60_18725 [Acidobacteriaceae bacterium]|jgi:hypothetical protein|nr:hypothetical protein [Acidobacteriaceae bacterium]
MDALPRFRSRNVLLILATGIALTTISLPAWGADFSIDAPADTSPATIVNSPFYVQAEAPTCNSATTTSLGYSVDTGGTTYVSGTTIETTLTLASGAHTIHFKSYNGTGHECTQDVAVNVGGGVGVSAPTLSATLPETFNLIAGAPTCGGQATTGMDYNVDSQTEGSPIDAASLNTLVDSNVSSGAHILRVKAWAGSIYCETDIPFSITGGIAAPAGVSVYTEGTSSYPYSGIESLANFSGAYNQTCPPNSPGTGNQGAQNPTLARNEWQTEPDCGTVGNKTNVSTTYPATGVLYGMNPESRQYGFTYSQTGGGVRWFSALTDNSNADAAKYFLYDVYVYIANGSNVGQIELDINHASPANDYYLMAVQCNLKEGYWDITLNGGWVKTGTACTGITTGAWHHLQVQSHHDAYPGTGIYYDQVSVDGSVHTLSCSGGCTNVEESKSWSQSVGPNFQLDGGGSNGSSLTAYTSNMVIWYW